MTEFIILSKDELMTLCANMPVICYLRRKGKYVLCSEEYYAEQKESRSENPNTCGDAISRQAVLNAMYELCNTGETLKENPWRDNPHIDAVVEAIEELPSVTPQQRTGRWIKQNYGWNWQCSARGFVTPPSAKDIFTFCPKCGCKMEVEE